MGHFDQFSPDRFTGAAFAGSVGIASVVAVAAADGIAQVRQRAEMRQERAEAALCAASRRLADAWLDVHHADLELRVAMAEAGLSGD